MKQLKNKGVISINSVRILTFVGVLKVYLCLGGYVFTSIYCHFSAIGAAGFSLGLNFLDYRLP